ncbi:MAG: tetratricopeptide repeat protein [bacterium]
MKEAVHDMYIRGKLHFTHGDFEEARKCFEMVLEQEPNLAEVHNKLGMIYHADGKFSKASSAFRKAVEINPNYTEAALNLVISLNESGKFEEAEAVFKKAASVVQASPYFIDPFIQGKLAGMHVETGDAYNEIGWFNEANHEYNMALKMRPNSMEVLTKIGLAYREKGDLNSAVKYLLQAKTVNPAYAPVLLHLGLTYHKQGKKDLAIEEWRAVQRLDPNNREAATFLRLVEGRDKTQ